MATPPRNLITADVKSSLEKISVSNGYKTNIVTVERVLKEWESIGSEQFPWLGFAFPREPIVHHPFGLIDVRMQGIIVGHINTGTDESRSNLLGEMQDDVIAALMVDCTRGGAAVNTLIKGDAENDEGDPDTMNTRGGTGSLVLRFEVFYQRTTEKS